MLIAKNVKWDKEGKFEKALRRYLKCCADEKFITARQAIQGLTTIIKTNSKYNEKIEKSLRNLQLSNYKENQQKLLNKDITATLKMLRIKI
jgi:ribosomal protein S21